MTRYAFTIQRPASGYRTVRLDSASGSDSPVSLGRSLSSNEFPDGVVQIDANSSGRTVLFGPDGVTTLYQKAVAYGSVVGSPVTLTGIDFSQPDISPGTDSAARTAAANAVPVITPSGDATGAADSAALAAGLASAGQIRLKPGGVYNLNGPLVLSSHQAVYAYGATIHQKTASVNIIRNTAAVPSASFTDASVTSGSGVITSAGLAAAAVVGNKVGFVGAGSGGSTCYGKVTAVSGSTVTIDVTALTTVASAGTVQLFPTRDTDISVLGGTWVMDVEPANGHQASSTYLNSFASAFRRIDGLRIRDTRWQMTGTAGQGGKFTVSVADCDDFVIDGTHFIATAGDGVHISGPCSNGVVSNTSGTTGDDFVVIGVQDNNTPYITDTAGGVSNVSVSGVKPSGSWSAFKLYDIGQLRKFTCSNIRVDDVSGTTQVQMIQILDATADMLSLTRIGGAPGATYPIIDLSTGSNVSEMNIEGVEWLSSNPATAGIVKMTQPRNSVRIRNLGFGTNPAGTNHFVFMTGALSGSTFGLDVLDVDGLYTPKQLNGAAATWATLHGITFSSTTGSGDSIIKVRNAHVQNNTAGYLINKGAATNTSRIVIADSEWNGSGLATIPTSDTGVVPVLHLDNVKGTSTNLVTTLSPIVAVVSGLHSITSGGAFSVGTGGTLRVLHIGGFRETGAPNTNIARTASQAISVNGLGFPVDLSIVTTSATDGDVATNSNAALACGAGPAVYHTAGTGNGWKGLYSAATY